MTIEGEIPEDARKSIIPEWADKKAEQVINMFRVGDTAFIDRSLLHGALAAALVQERERCARVAETAEMRSLAYGKNVPIMGRSIIASSIRSGV